MKLMHNREIKDFAYGNIKLQEPELLHASELEQLYLKSLDTDRLLAGFAETAGCKPVAMRYPGWEVTEIQGHTLGHYMTALAQSYGAAPTEELKKKLVYIAEKLAAYQREDGFLFASKEELFDRIENKKPAWVPWYTMHKILQGLVDIYHFTKDEAAYRVMTKLGTWIYNRCSRWDEAMQAQVLSVEYGGMNDCLYNLYMETKDVRFAEAAHMFDEEPLFQAMEEKRDILNGLHANTTIPKIIGALKRYLALGKAQERYLTVAENFWEMVVNHHTYITGGNSEWEHFGVPDVLDLERTACNCETCNTYNMLKLSKLLFQITGDSKYLDYYEQAFINAILSSQNPVTGMGTYFQPMATGYFKVYGTPYDSFWCCTGSSMENFTKLLEGIWYHDEDTIYLGRAVDSDVTWKEMKCSLKCRHEIEENIYQTSIQVVNAESGKVKLAVRIPDWSTAPAEVSRNGKPVACHMDQGFTVFEETLREGDVITVRLKMELQIQGLPDNPDSVAFQYGPYVLSAGLGKVMMDTDYTGVDVLVPKKDIVIRDYLLIEDTSIEDWKENIDRWMAKEKGKISFTLKSGNDTLCFTPHYKRFEDRYGIYWRLYKKGSRELQQLLQKQKLKEMQKKVQTDVVPVGNDQYELAHHIRGEKTDIIRVDGHVGRFLKEDGYVSYDMKPGKGRQALCVTLCGEDAGGTLEIWMDGRIFATEQVEAGQGYYTREYELPAELISGNNTVNVRFQNKDAGFTTHIYDEVFFKKTEG